MQKLKIQSLTVCLEYLIPCYLNQSIVEGKSHTLLSHFMKRDKLIKYIFCCNDAKYCIFLCNMCSIYIYIYN